MKPNYSKQCSNSISFLILLFFLFHTFAFIALLFLFFVFVFILIIMKSTHRNWLMARKIVHNLCHTIVSALLFSKNESFNCFKSGCVCGWFTYFRCYCCSCWCFCWTSSKFCATKMTHLLMRTTPLISFLNFRGSNGKKDHTHVRVQSCRFCFILLNNLFYIRQTQIIIFCQNSKKEISKQKTTIVFIVTIHP